MDDNTLVQTLVTLRDTYTTCTSISELYIMFGSYVPHTCDHAGSIFLSKTASGAHMHTLSLSHTHTCTQTPSPSCKSVFSTAHFLSSPIKMTAADISTREGGGEGKEQIYLVESQNWVQITSLCLGSLDFFLPVLTLRAYLQDTNFCLPFNTGLTHFVMFCE